MGICGICGADKIKTIIRYEQGRRAESCEYCRGLNKITRSSKGVVAIMADEAGGQYGLDSKGRKVDLTSTYYDLQRDPRGWEVAGKVKKGGRYP